MSADTIATLTGLGRQYEVIAHNLANTNTVGYKRRVGLYHQDEPEAGAGGTGEAAPGRPGGPAVRADSAVDFTQGRLVQTGRSLDVALSGPGFFVVETDEGPRYTRDGVFRVSDVGQLVDGRGRTVAGEGGPVTIPASVSPMAVEIASDGRISAGGTRIGRLRIVEFDDPAVLEPAGAGTLRAPRDARPGAAEKTTVEQGFQEASNVEAVNELVALIKVTRLYQANIHVMTTKGNRGKELLRVAMT